MNFEAFFSPWRPYALSVLRIMTALLYLEEGTMKYSISRRPGSTRRCSRSSAWPA